MNNKLRQFREAAGMTQFELGAKARVHPTLISHIETGRHYAYPAARRRLALVLGFKEHEIFETESKIK